MSEPVHINPSQWEEWLGHFGYLVTAAELVPGQVEEVGKELHQTREVLEGISSAIDELSIYMAAQNALGTIELLLHALPSDQVRGMVMREVVREFIADPATMRSEPRTHPVDIEHRLFKLLRAQHENRDAVP